MTQGGASGALEFIKYRSSFARIGVADKTRREKGKEQSPIVVYAHE